MVSVIVVSWNAKEYVQECLESLCDQTLKEAMEIVLVDNASTDGTPQMVQRLFPRVTLIQNRENLGFAAANNIGLRMAQGDFIYLINSDVNVPPSCLDKMHSFMTSNPDIGMLGPRMLGVDGRVARSYMRFPGIWSCLCTALRLDSLFRGISLFGGGLMTDFDPGHTAEVEVLNGWFLAVRRQAMEHVGLLDERFFMYGEDIDWSYRFHCAGYKRVYYAEAEALHYGAVSSSAASIRFYIEMHRANLQYWQKYHGLFGLAGYWVMTVLHHSVRAAGHSLSYMLTADKVEAAFKVRRSLACITWLIRGRGAHA